MGVTESGISAQPQAEKISLSDADNVVAAVLNYAMNSDKQLPLSQEALVRFTEGLIQAVVTVRRRCVSA